MSSWLFQFNPDDFDGDGYLNAIDRTFAWRVSMHRRRVRPGDRVFVWKAMGLEGLPQLSGVVAEATITSEVSSEAIDPRAQPFIRDPEFPTVQNQVWLQLVRSTAPRIVISREAALADEVLNGMTILHFARRADHALTHEQAERISALWR